MRAAASHLDFASQALRLLTQMVACATDGQLLQRAHQLGVSRRSAVEQLRELRRDGMVQAKRLVVRRVDTGEAIRRFTPDETPTDFGRLSSQLCRRWQNAPQTRPLVYWATRRATGLLGSAVGAVVDSHKTDHDLALTDVLIGCLADDPKLCWFHEASLDSLQLVSGKLRPDAVVWPTWSDKPRAIEIGGQYSTRRLRRLHNAMAKSDLEWELR